MPSHPCVSNIIIVLTSIFHRYMFQPVNASRMGAFTSSTSLKNWMTKMRQCSLLPGTWLKSTTSALDRAMVSIEIDWTDTSLRYRHWRMCFEWLLQSFARWQPSILFDIAAQPILEYHWMDSYSQPSLRTQFKVATVYSIHTQSLSWCSTGLVPNVLPRRDEGSGKPCAVDRAS